MENPLPQDPVIEKQTVIPHENFGGHDKVLVRSHIAPSSTEVDGEAAFDPYHDQNNELAAKVFEFLWKNYPVEYDWNALAFLEYGIVVFNIPVLMGGEDWAVINLKTHGTNDKFGEAVCNLAGQILERYGLSRERYNLGAFLDARAKHSKLIMPWKKIPG